MGLDTQNLPNIFPKRSEKEDEGLNVKKERNSIFYSATTVSEGYISTQQINPMGKSGTGAGNVLIAPFDGIMKNLIAEIGINPGAGDTVNLGFQLNGTLSALKQTWTGGETGRKTNKQEEIEVVEGDEISIEINGSAGPGARNIKVNMELEPI